MSHKHSAKIGKLDLMSSSGIGISIQAYLKSGNFNLKTGGNSKKTGRLMKQAFVYKQKEYLGGYEQLDENKLNSCLDQLLVYDDLWLQ